MRGADQIADMFKKPEVNSRLREIKSLYLASDGHLLTFHTASEQVCCHWWPYDRPRSALQVPFEAPPMALLPAHCLLSFLRAGPRLAAQRGRRDERVARG